MFFTFDPTPSPEGASVFPSWDFPGQADHDPGETVVITGSPSPAGRSVGGTADDAGR